VRDLVQGFTSYFDVIVVKGVKPVFVGGELLAHYAAQREDSVSRHVTVQMRPKDIDVVVTNREARSQQ
jgi:hypothetical protein